MKTLFLIALSIFIGYESTLFTKVTPENAAYFAKAEVDSAKFSDSLQIADYTAHMVHEKDSIIEHYHFSRNRKLATDRKFL